MALSSHFISRPAVFGFALIYGFSLRHLSVCNLSPEQQVIGGCAMIHILYIKLLHVIFIPNQALMYAGGQPRVRANRHLYGGGLKL